MELLRDLVQMWLLLTSPSPGAPRSASSCTAAPHSAPKAVEDDQPLDRLSWSSSKRFFVHVHALISSSAPRRPHAGVLGPELRDDRRVVVVERVRRRHRGGGGRGAAAERARGAPRAEERVANLGLQNCSNNKHGHELRRGGGHCLRGPAATRERLDRDGVRGRPRGGEKYVAQHKTVYLGIFDTAVEAAVAFTRAAEVAKVLDDLVRQVAPARVLQRQHGNPSAR